VSENLFPQVTSSSIMASYNYSNEEYKPDLIPYPTWPEIKVVRTALEKLSHLYFGGETAAYKAPHDGERYVVFVLDLHDRPMRVFLYESGQVQLTSPLWLNLPHDACHFVLKEIASRHSVFSFHLEYNDVLVATMDNSSIEEALMWSIPYFVEQTSRALEDLVRFIKNDQVF
jgi:hypothetical protein